MIDVSSYIRKKSMPISAANKSALNRAVTIAMRKESRMKNDEE
jgi:hypothetical protein